MLVSFISIIKMYSILFFLELLVRLNFPFLLLFKGNEHGVRICTINFCRYLFSHSFFCISIPCECSQNISGRYFHITSFIEREVTVINFTLGFLTLQIFRLPLYMYDIYICTQLKIGMFNFVNISIYINMSAFAYCEDIVLELSFCKW